MRRRSAGLAALIGGGMAWGCQTLAGLGDFAPDDDAAVTSVGPGGGDDGDGGAAGTGGGGDSPSSSSSASTGSSGSGSSSGGGEGGCGPDHLVIAEVRTRGPSDGNQDFIEILNPTGRVIQLDPGWRIDARGEDTNVYLTRWTGDGSLLIGPNQRVLLANDSVDNPLGGATADDDYASGVKDGGSVVLYRFEEVVDAVCFTCEVEQLGDVDFICEGQAFARPEGCELDGDRSVKRRAAGGVPGCADADDGAQDLVDDSPSTPQGLGG